MLQGFSYWNTLAEMSMLYYKLLRFHDFIVLKSQKIRAIFPIRCLNLYLPQGVYFIQTDIGTGRGVPIKFVKM
jgi:hypothetical protein